MSRDWRDRLRGIVGRRGGALPAGAALAGARINVGCGSRPLAGWINVDVQSLPGVDRVLDVRHGLPFRDAAAVYAEHFLEHLSFPEALDFLRAANAALAPGGRLRLSTPNLEWVWETHRPQGGEGDEALRRAFVANRAFYGWQHRFLWTRPLLAEALAACGFERIAFTAYGESDDPALAGLEQHPRDPDGEGLPHVLVVEAARGRFDRARLERFRAAAREHLLDHLRG
jgi:predicted SAM-dependent methyltransferase